MKIYIVQHDGTAHEVDALEGDTLMQVVVDNGITGIDGDCGGACACGTCHCYVDEVWRDRLDRIGAAEDSMLGMRPDRAPGSRLACQIDLDKSLEGLRVRLPEYQM
ncbi:MAG: 2Fe-2S iron-sulfur cluster-binding protein [Alcanivoracaceae bacterium]|jgi:2Fe-2S ferredoxin|nr:2Fe-2S iron-sulfur cluster-binding protein [Alcanivoracaceae bacterium]